MEIQLDDKMIQQIRTISYRYRYVVEDAFSVACIYVLRKLKKYDATKSSLSTYIFSQTHYGLKEEIRKNKRKLRGVDVKFNNVNALKHSLTSDTDIEQEYLENEIKCMVRKVLLNLRAKDRLVLYFIFFLERPQKDLMPILKISQGRVAQLRKKALERFKKIYLSSKDETQVF